MGKPTVLCGIDEAGRGSLSSVLVAAACVLGPGQPIRGLNDSKKLSARRREKLYHEITTKAVAWSIGIASREEVDRLNVLEATFLAMRRAVEGLSVKPSFIQVDGDKIPRGLPCTAQAVVGGDGLVPEIMAASILAKVTRDAHMDRIHDAWPVYRFDLHRGYGTALHMEMLLVHGPCPEHRMSYAPVQRAAKARGMYTGISAHFP